MRRWAVVMVSSAAMAVSAMAADAVAGPETSAQATTQAAAPRYFEVPVFGTIGQHVTPEAIELAFNEAERLKASYVMLLIDSDGGDMIDANAMVRTIRSHRKITSVAFVKKATNGAALIAASCAKVYAHGSGIWGVSSAEACRYMDSYRAELEELAERGGRNPLVMNALADSAAELCLSVADGKAFVTSKPVEGGRMIKQRDSGFLLTPDDLVASGMADAVCTTRADMRTALGLEDWTSCGDRGTQIVQELSRAANADPVAGPTRVITIGPDPNEPRLDPETTRGYRESAKYQKRELDTYAGMQERRIAEEKRYQERMYQERRRMEEERVERERKLFVERENAREAARKRRIMDSR